ncbi:MAG: hypothetical protein ABH813_00920 [Patescibacteria group bacterium]
MEFVKVNCKNCGKVFLKDKRHYKENQELKHNFYCSIKCESTYKRRRRRTLACENCGKSFLRQPSDLSPHNYCSQSCAAIINNKNRPERGAKTIKCKNCGIKFKKWISNNKKYCSLKCRKEAECYTPKELLNIIKNTFKKLGRVPARREMLKGSDKACLKFFGSWNNAVIAAGFEPNRSHSDRMYKRIITKASDGHLCDSASEAIIDNWLLKNNIPHKRDSFYPGTHYKADWEITLENQKIFVEYFGLANDSPRYDRAVGKKKNLCQKNNIPLIEIYSKDIFPRNFLESNLKGKFKEFLKT